MQGQRSSYIIKRPAFSPPIPSRNIMKTLSGSIFRQHPFCLDTLQHHLNTATSGAVLEDRHIEGCRKSPEYKLIAFVTERGEQKGLHF